MNYQTEFVLITHVSTGNPKVTEAQNPSTQWLRYLTRERRNSFLPKIRELLYLARD
jgi:hypothetical protein